MNIKAEGTDGCTTGADVFLKETHKRQALACNTEEQTDCVQGGSEKERTWTMATLDTHVARLCPSR